MAKLRGRFFHKAHPFLLPRRYMVARLESDPDSLQHLMSAVRYIGSLYAPEIPSDGLRDRALAQVGLSDLPPNGFTVQALLITAIATHSEDDVEHARHILNRAIYLALEIGLHSRTFANMESDPVMAECWRRTYWGCYIVDGNFATMRRSPGFM